MLNFFKRLIKLLPIAFTKNQRYDRQSKKIIAKVCSPNSNCIDVGCHKGEVMDIIQAAAPAGKHFGFEPIPDLYKALVRKYRDSTCYMFDIALSNEKGETSFNYVISNPSYSGLRKRKYDRKHEEDTLITVSTDTLDNVIPKDLKIDLIKIDVEGGELLVLEGGKELITKNKPVIIFEHGLGASEFYASTPEKVFTLLQNCGLEIALMKDYLKGKSALDLESFKIQFEKKLNYYFVAYS